MKKLFIVCLSLILLLVFAGAIFIGNNKENNKSDFLRIHIRANSNSEVDQSIKFAIKDEFIEFLTPKLACCGSKADVMNMIQREKQSLENVANNVLADSGLNYKSNVKIQAEEFPTRTYENLTLESGIYDAIIVELGSAE